MLRKTKFFNIKFSHNDVNQVKKCYNTPKKNIYSKCAAEVIMDVLVIFAFLLFLLSPLLWLLGFIWGFVWDKVLKPLITTE